MKVLIIEDDQSIARLEKNYLEINGYEVIHDPLGDLDYIMGEIENVDLVILDLMLPNADGFEICKAIRSKVSIPIIIISAKDQDMDVVLGLGLGANDYMKKPFSPNELIARVKSQLANYDRVLSIEKNTNNTIVLRGLTVEPDLNQASYNGRVIELTKKTEFDILHLLMKNQGRVFSKKRNIRKNMGTRRPRIL